MASWTFTLQGHHPTAEDVLYAAGIKVPPAEGPRRLRVTLAHPPRGRRPGTEKALAALTKALTGAGLLLDGPGNVEFEPVTHSRGKAAALRVVLVDPAGGASCS